MHIWAEAARTAVYVQNRTPHRVLKKKTPEEVFFGKKPKVSHLRIFSYPVYIHIPKEKRTKLDPSRKKGVIADFTTHGESHFYGLPYPYAYFLDPMDLFCSFDVSLILPKNM